MRGGAERAARLCGVLLVLWCWQGVVWAAEGLGVRSPFLSQSDEIYLLTTRLDFELPAEVRQAINDGAVLSLTAQVRVSRSRNWWRDALLAELEQRYELVYHAISDRYVVRNLNSGAQSSYADLDAALLALRSIDRLPILDKALIMPDSRNEISLRGTVEVRSIPSALSMLLFWKRDFMLQSDWYTWPLKS